MSSLGSSRRVRTGLPPAGCRELVARLRHEPSFLLTASELLDARGSRLSGGAGLAAALRLTDSGRPRVEDLLALLGGIAKEADSAGSSNREIDQAARWVQRTLHDVLRDDVEPHPAPETVRVLASQDGVTRFVAEPPFAEDPLLRDTFEKQRPLLSAEAGLNKLTR